MQDNYQVAQKACLGLGADPERGSSQDGVGLFSRLTQL